MLSLLNTTFTNTLRQGFTLIGRFLSKLKARSTYFENQAGTKVILKEIESAELLEKASIITTPTVYSDGVLHSVKPGESPYADFTFTRNNIGTRLNASGNIDTVGVDLPRIDYLGGTEQILLEPASTNTATYSNDFMNERLDIFNGSSKPTLLNAVLTKNQGTSLDGENNAFLLKDNNDGETGQTSLNYYSSVVNFNDFNTFSVFVKKSLSNDFIILSTGGFDSDANGTTCFNINNGSLGTISTNHTAKIEDYGNGWYRCSITNKITTDQQGAFRIILATADNQAWSTRNGTNGVLLFGLQAESHATRQYATSYIPTSGSPQTRGADLATDAGSSDLISSTEGVLYGEISASSNEAAGYRVICLNDGSDISKFVMLGIDPTINAFFGSINGIVIGYITPADATTFFKLAIRYKNNESKFFVNGVQVGTTNTTATIPSGLNRLAFDLVGTSPFEGNVKCVAVFKEALTDQELTALTS